MAVQFSKLPVFAEFHFQECDYQKISASRAVTLPSCNSDGGSGHTFDPHARVVPAWTDPKSW